MIRKVFEQGEGVLRLAPTWVPRSFCIPGKRLKLHPADLYTYGAVRGGIDERWLASTTKADKGPLTTPGARKSTVRSPVVPGHSRRDLTRGCSRRSVWPSTPRRPRS